MRSFILTLLIATSLSVTAREFKGYLITHEKDTLSGTIVTGRNRLLDEEVAVQYAIDFTGNFDKKRNISPRDINGYALISDRGDTVFYEAVRFQRKSGFGQKLSEVYVFMEMISAGPIDMYHFFEHVNAGARGADLAYSGRDKMFIKPTGSSYAIKIPFQKNDEGYSENFDYYKFLKDILGADHPCLSVITPGLTADALISAIKEYNKKS